MKEIYEKMGIYYLRNLAREMGIKSPTTKKKSQIIDEIVNLKPKAGLMQTKRGRPPLHKVEIEFENNLKNKNFVIKQLYLLKKLNEKQHEVIKNLIKNV